MISSYNSTGKGLKTVQYVKSIQWTYQESSEMIIHLSEEDVKG